MQKTVIVAVEMPKKHPVYGKIMKNTRRFVAKNDINAALGADVLIEESRPFSKTGRFHVVKLALNREEK